MLQIAMWQGLQSDSISAGNTRLLMIFVGVVAVSTFLQLIFVAVAAMAARNAQKRLLVIAEELRSRALPILDTTEVFLKETLPKVKTVTDSLVETSQIVRSKAREFDSTLTDVNVKTKAQVARLDGMVSSALTATGSLAAMIHHGIRVPVVEAVGIVNGFKAGLDVLFSKSGSSPNGTALIKKATTALAVFKEQE